MSFYEECFYIFRRFFKGSLKQLNEKTIYNYTIHLQTNTNNNATSIRTRLRGLRTFLYHLMKLGYLEEFKIQLPKAEQKPKETYTDKELSLLLKRPDIKDTSFSEFRTYAVINFLIGTGCRAATLCSVKIKHLDFDSGYITFAKTKNKKAQVVPMSSTLNKVLKEYLEYRGGENDDYLFPTIYDSKLTSHSLHLSVKKYNNSRGVPRTSIHAFRHTFAKHYITNGGDIFRLQKILGHSSLDMVRNYVNMYSADLKNNFDKYNPLEQLASRTRGKQLKLKGLK
jgi:integrase/recombinase XerD